MQLHTHDVHIWTADLNIDANWEAELLKTLSADEITRAERFLSPLHRTRFIASHGILRKILSLYLIVDPKIIIFSLGEQKKPYIEGSAIQFNMAHSEDKAVYAFTLDHHIGVDIEKIQNRHNDDVIER